MKLQLSKMRQYKRGLFNQTSFRSELHVHFLCGPRAVCWKQPFEENSIIRNRGLPRRETPRKDGPISPKFFVRLQSSDVELAGTTRLH